ncbi:hypothetical protein IEQ34_016241 [Dendrobium chrysotoxum]|uniref:Uncharacterized protein n=1 Tax=Dendrobium chrysotoxum TaxID=161865 RepID=A0AAV7GDS5_DENCH|nr:hypothetical protein IEQ34_016241 [Dendrobium chrysotoxum]
MEEFLTYCVHCNSLGHSKVECHVLYPHLNNSTTVNPAHCIQPSTAVGDNVLHGCGEVDGVVELPLVVNSSSELVALASIGPMVSDARVITLEILDLDNSNGGVLKVIASGDQCTFIGEDLVYPMQEENDAVQDVGVVNL